ncbi:hypothetical protein PIB30_053761 [Stylosanthes scabra]|uniref:DUF4283 domain-containing protein n=1 Tax=Stylosanthes scabra TaxID=79078 RepID=A0ABU6TIB8_9FABA|nr:hypothetical protein [Stylosanthes scabra]
MVDCSGGNLPSMAGDDQGDPDMIYFEEEIVAQSLQSCSPSSIGRILADQKFSVGTLKAALGAIWSHPTGFKVEDTGQHDDLTHVPLWLQFWDIPEHFKTKELGRVIAKSFGKVKDVDFFAV